MYLHGRQGHHGSFGVEGRNPRPAAARPLATAAPGLAVEQYGQEAASRIWAGRRHRPDRGHDLAIVVASGQRVSGPATASSVLAGWPASRLKPQAPVVQFVPQPARPATAEAATLDWISETAIRSSSTVARYVVSPSAVGRCRARRRRPDGDGPQRGRSRSRREEPPVGLLVEHVRPVVGGLDGRLDEQMGPQRVIRVLRDRKPCGDPRCGERGNPGSWVARSTSAGPRPRPPTASTLSACERPRSSGLKCPGPRAARPEPNSPS